MKTLFHEDALYSGKHPSTPGVTVTNSSSAISRKIIGNGLRAVAVSFHTLTLAHSTATHQRRISESCDFSTEGHWRERSLPRQGPHTRVWSIQGPASNTESTSLKQGETLVNDQFRRTSISTSQAALEFAVIIRLRFEIDACHLRD